MTVRFSVIVPTVGRPSLARALASLVDQLSPEDEVLVVGASAAAPIAQAAGARFLPHPLAGDYGYTERAYGITHARGTHLAFLDDDDVYLPGALAAMRAEVTVATDRPHLFRMIAPWGETLWRVKGLMRRGDFGGAQFVTPNDPARLGQYSTAYEADYDFIESTLAHYPPEALVWSPTVIYRCAPGVGRDVLLREARA